MNFTNNDISSIGFTVTNNVYVTVLNKETKKVVKQIETHNKATRKMVCGLLKFIAGNFYNTMGSKNSNIPEDNIKLDNISDYIPCYIGFGNGWVDIEKSSQAEDKKIPIYEEGFGKVTPDNYVDYTATHMKREYAKTRSPISAISTTLGISETTLDNKSFPDMDSIYFQCQVEPNAINDGFNAAYITEIGLFADNIPNTPEHPTDDMLAYVKLLNYTKKEGNIETQYNEEFVIYQGTRTAQLDNKFVDASNNIRFIDTEESKEYIIKKGIILDSENVPCGTFDYNLGYFQFYDVFEEDTTFEITYDYIVGTPATNALYVRPEDTIIIRWVISIASIGIDSTFSSRIIVDERNRAIENTVIIPEVTPIAINVIDSEPNSNTNN